MLQDGGGAGGCVCVREDVKTIADFHGSFLIYVP